MLGTLWEGILWGLPLSLAAGPIFFMLIQLGIERGVLAGMALSAGVLFSDIPYMIVVYQGVEWLSGLPHFSWYMGMVGGSILLLFGLATMLSKYKPPQGETIKASTYGGYFLKGILINVFNPFVFVLWIAVTGNMVKQNMDFGERSTFFFGIIATVALTDFIKVLLAWKIRKFMQPKHFQWLRYVAGTALIVIGLFMMCSPPDLQTSLPQ